MSSSLDTGKYVSLRSAEQKVSVRYRFRHFEALRSTLLFVAGDCGVSQKGLTRFRNCGDLAGVYENDETHELKVRSRHCKNRWCPACGHYAQARTKKRVLTWLKTHGTRNLKFVTLTLAPSSVSLSERIAHLLKSFRRLRSSQLWRALNAQGLAVVETTYSAVHASWHTHLHVVACLNYVHYKALSEAWRVASSGSFIVDIRTLSRDIQPEKVAEYVSSYVSKAPAGVAGDNLPLVREWVLALTNCHWVVAFGKRNEKLTEPETLPKERLGDWIYVDTLFHLVQRAESGDAYAASVLARLDDAREVDTVCDPPSG